MAASPSPVLTLKIFIKEVIPEAATLFLHSMSRISVPLMYYTLLHICEDINISNREKYDAQENIDNLTAKSKKNTI